MPEPETQSHTLFVRLDRLGDLVLTLPVDQLKQFEAHRKSWIIPKGLEFVLESTEPRRSFKSMTKTTNWKNFWSLVQWLKDQNFDQAIVFHAPWWIGLALLLSGVKKRHIRKSQWHSYFFYNSGIRQKRSRAELHELEYNLELAYRSQFSNSENKNYISADKSKLYEALKNDLPSGSLKDIGLHLKSTCDLSEDIHEALTRKFVVVHAGMGGSALNWPIEKYVDCINELSQKNLVVMTGTKGDRPYLEPIRKELDEIGNILWLNEKLSGSELIKVLSQATAVIAPSTGVLHLAASCQVPTIGIFSPVRVQRSDRWGGVGNKTINVAPDIKDCPGTLECLKEQCPKYFCMDQLSATKVTDCLSHLSQT